MPFPARRGGDQTNPKSRNRKTKQMNKCCDRETQCETSCASEDCEPSCGAETECPIQCAADKWQDSFCQAMSEVQVDILKAKILKAHGPLLEQAADAFLETAMACWQSQIAQVKQQQAGEAFKAKLFELWTQEQKH